jgi:hypothetical protein
MNERIEKLLEQCQIETYGVNGELLEFGFDAKKLAELIVRECIKIVEYKGNKSGKDHPVGFNLLDAAQDIKEHFGVEE